LQGAETPQAGCCNGVQKQGIPDGSGGKRQAVAQVATHPQENAGELRTGWCDCLEWTVVLGRFWTFRAFQPMQFLVVLVHSEKFVTVRFHSGHRLFYLET